MNEIDIVVFPRWTLRGKKWFFHLKSGGNNKIIAQSEAYNTKGGAKHTADIIADGKFQVVVLDN